MVRTLLNEVFLGGNKQECIKTQSSIETTVIGQRLLTNIYRPLNSLSKKGYMFLVEEFNRKKHNGNRKTSREDNVTVRHMISELLAFKKLSRNLV